MYIRKGNGVASKPPVLDARHSVPEVFLTYAEAWIGVWLFPTVDVAAVSLFAIGASLPVVLNGSAEASGVSVAGAEDSVVVDLPLGTARLGLRKRLPSFDDLLPSPSSPSPSEVASAFFSFFVPRVLKKDVRRAGLVLSGAAPVVFRSFAAVKGSVGAAAGVAAVSAPEGLTGSSI